jgi:hypothetical protein
MRYYQAGEAIEGLNVTWLLGLLAGQRGAAGGRLL